MLGESSPANGPGSKFGAVPEVWDSNYIHACHESRWKLATWKKSAPDVVSWRPARCCSWRHAGPCRQQKAQQDYARISEALARHERAHVSYLVLTVDPSAWTAEGNTGDATKKKGAIYDLEARNRAYKELVDCWHELRRAIKRRFGSLEYVCTVECHKSGWPHINVIAVSESLTAEIASASLAFDNMARQFRGRKTCEMVLSKELRAAGFGRIGFAEIAAPLESDGGDRLAGYIAKLAGQAQEGFLGEETSGLVDSFDSKMVGEIIKASQVPTMAPKNFRRLRSSKGFLPKVKKDENLTGALFDDAGKRIGKRRSQDFAAAIWHTESRDAVEAAQKLVGIIEDKERAEGRANRGDYDAFWVLSTWKLTSGAVPWGEGELGSAVASICGPYAPRRGGQRVALDPAGERTVRTDCDEDIFTGYEGPGMSKPARKFKLRPDLTFRRDLESPSDLAAADAEFHHEPDHE